MNKLPYFDSILEQLDHSNPRIISTMGTNVHWGYWSDPRAADTSFEGYRIATDAMTEQLFADARLEDGQTILDVGCGFGGTIALLDSRHDGLVIHGLNIDPRQIARARHHVIPRSIVNNRIEFCVADACRLPYSPGTFDVVFAVECIFHFPSIPEFFKEAFRVLKPGGRLVLSDFIIYGPSIPALPWLGLFHSSAVTRTYGTGRSVRTRRLYSCRARETGFKPLSSRNITSNTMPTYDVLDKLAPELPDLGEVFRRANRYVRLLFRLGICQYLVFSFGKPE